MDLRYIGKIFGKMIFFTHHAWVLDFTLILITLNGGLLGFAPPCLEEAFLDLPLFLFFCLGFLDEAT